MFTLLYLAAVTLPTSLAVYLLPQLHLQAKATGGIKAFLPDSCGVQGFGFQIKGKDELSWKTGNGTRENQFWTFLDKAATASPGDEYQYAARVWHQGYKYSFPISSWVVTELVDDFTFPPYEEFEENCTSEELSKEEKANVKELPVTTVRQPTTTPGTTMSSSNSASPSSSNTEPPSNSESSSSVDSPSSSSSPRTRHSLGRGKTLETAASTETEAQPPNTVPSSAPALTFSIACQNMGAPSPNMSREEMLERQLSILQCEMSSFLDRTTKLTKDLNRELLDLKKLNYETVARMQRLESLIRTIPRAVPFSYI